MAEQKINEYEKSMLLDMSKKVLEHLAKKHSRVKKKVGVIMGGQILDYEAKDILNKGRAEGRAEVLETLVKKLLQNDFFPEQVAGYLDTTVEEVLQYCS